MKTITEAANAGEPVSSLVKGNVMSILNPDKVTGEKQEKMENHAERNSLRQG